jgi:uncharacterized protein YuzE
MYIDRDLKYNLVYISFRDTLEKGEVAKTEELTPGTYGDFDSDGYLIGIEIVNTKRVLGFAANNIRLSGELLGVKEAAELAGKDRANFLRDLASRPDFPEPVARLASGQLWLSIDVVRYLREHLNGPDSRSQTTGEHDTNKEKQPTKLPYRGWQYRDWERYRDYRYEDHEQYEDHELIDTPGTGEESVPLEDVDEVDHEVHGSDEDTQNKEEQESA